MRYHVAAAVVTALIPAIALAASGVERWTAASTTAIGITGDITLSPTRLTAAGRTFPLAVAADVKDFTSNTGMQAARILRVTHPSDPILKNGNTLCGAPVRWIAVYRSDGGKSLNLSAFTGGRQPTGETGSNLCGTFLYTR